MRFEGIKKFLLALIVAAIPFSAAAQSGAIIQSGTVTAGHAGVFATQNVMQDAGTSVNGGFSSLGVTNSGSCGFGVNSSAITGPYYQTCIGGSGTFSFSAFGGASVVPFNFIINGTTYQIGGSNWLSGWFDSQFCTTQGSILYRSGTVWGCLPPGLSGQVLQTKGGGQNPAWSTVAGTGTVTSITAGTGLTGGTITTSGTIGTAGVLNDLALISQAQGDIYYYNGSNLVALPPGTSGSVLTTQGASANPIWSTGALPPLTSADIWVGNGSNIATATALSGDATLSNSGALTIANNAVTNTKIAQATANTLKGNPTGSTANVQDTSVPSCSGGESALTWTSGTGFGCNIFTSLVLRSYISGLTLSTAGSSSTFSVAAGVAADSTNVAMMNLSSALAKTTSAWSSGNNGGCLDTGTIAASTWYAEFEIEDTAGPTIDIVCTKETAGSAPSPTLPSGYTLERYIGSLRTDSSSNWLSVVSHELGGGSVEVAYTAALASLDVNNVTLPTASRTLYTLTVPTGIVVKAIFNINGAITSGTAESIWISDPATNDVAPAIGLTGPLGMLTLTASTNNQVGVKLEQWTNTSAQIGLRSTSPASSASVQTLGWIDPR